MPYRDQKQKVAAVRKWQKANPDKERFRKRRQHATMSAEDRERYRKRKREAARANKTKSRYHSALRRARRRKAAVPLTVEEQARVVGIYAEARAMTELSGEPYHVDHIKPLAKGGLHHPDNLQVLRGIVNLRKGVLY